MKKMLTGISAFAVLALMSSVAFAAATPDPTNPGPASNPGPAPSSDPKTAHVVLIGTVKEGISIKLKEKIEPIDFDKDTEVKFSLVVASNRGAVVTLFDGAKGSYVNTVVNQDKSSQQNSSIKVTSITWGEGATLTDVNSSKNSQDMPKKDVDQGAKEIQVRVVHSDEDAKKARPGTYKYNMSFNVASK